MLEGYNILKGIKSIQGQDKFRGQAKDFSPTPRSSSVISIFLNTFLTGNISDKLFEEISSNYAFKEVIQSYSQSNIFLLSEQYIVQNTHQVIRTQEYIRTLEEARQPSERQTPEKTNCCGQIQKNVLGLFYII